MEGPSHVDIGNYETLSRGKGRGGRRGCGGRAVVLFSLGGGGHICGSRSVFSDSANAVSGK